MSQESPFPNSPVESTKLTHLTGDDRLRYLLENFPDQMTNIPHAFLSRLLRKSVRDFNAPSDCLHEGD